MGKASSAKKVARAARAGGKARRSSSRNWTFPAAVALVVALGVGLVVFARAGQDEAAANEAPRIGLDHWHAAYGIYNCDTFLPPVTDQNDPLGIHTHSDGVIHIHPTSSRAAGENARFGVFAEAAGIELSDDSVSLEGAELQAGDECDGEPAVLRAVRWNVDDPEDQGTEFTADFDDIRFTRDRQAITIALVPEGAEVPRPDSVPTLDNLTDVAPQNTQPQTLPSVTNPPDATGTTGTLSGATSSSTDTTAADGEGEDDASTTTSSP